MTDEEQRAADLIQFRLKIGIPHVWRYKAENLKHAASRLMQISQKAGRAMARRKKKALARVAGQPVTQEEALLIYDKNAEATAMTLEALAFENLLKGILVASMEPANVTIGSRLPSALKGHNLSSLAKKAGLPLTTDEVSILDALTECILWKGRYMIPLNFEDYRTKKSKTGYRSWDSLKQQTEVDKLWDRLWSSPPGDPMVHFQAEMSPVKPLSLSSTSRNETPLQSDPPGSSN